MAHRSLRWLTASLALGAGTIPVTTLAASPPTSTASGSAASAAAAPQEFAPDDPAFFDVPNPIPAGAHGDLIRFQAVDTSFVNTYRIMYLSQSVNSAPTVVTGLVSSNEDQAPFGGYRLLLYGHGTTGLADACAPSRVVGTIDDDYAQEFESASSATNDAFVVVSTDYEGIGGPGRHPYLVGISEGRSMLDAGLAARQVPGLYIGPLTAIFGFSQGGHAALWATQLAAEWTPERPITGTLLAAPASEVVDYVRLGVNDPALAAGAVSVVAGLAGAYPDAAAAIGSLLTPAGQELVAQMDEHCFDESITMPSGSLLAGDPTSVEPFASLIAANTAGTVAAPSPILVFQGDLDENVSLAWSDQLMARLCAAGQMIERRVLPGQAHFATSSIASRDGIPWLVGLFAGTPPVSSCTG